MRTHWSTSADAPLTTTEQNFVRSLRPRRGDSLRPRGPLGARVVVDALYSLEHVCLPSPGELSVEIVYGGAFPWKNNVLVAVPKIFDDGGFMEI